MDPSVPLSPTELYELLGVVGGLGVSGVVGFLLVRRARAARLRQIESAGELPAPAPPAEAEAPEPTPPKRGGRAQTSARPARAEEPSPGAAATASRAAAHAPAKRERAADETPEPGAAGEAERRAAQVIPFPVPAPPPPVPAPARKAKDAAALAPGLARTRAGWVSRLGEIFAGRKELDPSMMADVEKVLLTADIGVRTSQQLLEEIRNGLTRRELSDPDAIWALLRKRAAEMLAIDAPTVDFAAAQPFVVLIIGVNGSGKTTTIGKLAAKLGSDGKKVLLAAGDTFRAAATEQLAVWAERTGATIVRGKEGADPSSVIFDGVKRAASEAFDVVIADTAGRLHTKADLMQELQKVRRVIGKASTGAPHETWLVIDATSGQNAIAQAQIFTQAMSVSGIVLTKLDGTAKGGVILGIADQLKIPVRYVGIGERVEDLRPFDPDEFVEALFAPPNSAPN